MWTHDLHGIGAILYQSYKASLEAGQEQVQFIPIIWNVLKCIIRYRKSLSYTIHIIIWYLHCVKMKIFANLKSWISHVN